jgi:hypothetical protein
VIKCTTSLDTHASSVICTSSWPHHTATSHTINHTQTCNGAPIDATAALPPTTSTSSRATSARDRSTRCAAGSANSAPTLTSTGSDDGDALSEEVDAVNVAAKHVVVTIAPTHDDVLERDSSSVLVRRANDVTAARARCQPLCCAHARDHMRARIHRVIPSTTCATSQTILINRCSAARSLTATPTRSRLLQPTRSRDANTPDWWPFRPPTRTVISHTTSTAACLRKAATECARLRKVRIVSEE